MGRGAALRRSVDGGAQGKLIRGVRALYSSPPTTDDIESAGLTLESDEIRTPNDDGWFYDGRMWVCEFPLWASNWPAMSLYTQYMQTQWRHGFSGPTGLDYNVLLHELDRRNLPRDEYDDLFGSLRVIERAALDEMHKAA